MPPRNRRKRAGAAAEPPLDWLRQSVWAGEELPDELELLEMMEPEPEPEPVKPAAPKPKPKRRAK